MSTWNETAREIINAALAAGRTVWLPDNRGCLRYEPDPVAALDRCVPDTVVVVVGNDAGDVVDAANARTVQGLREAGEPWAIVYNDGDAALVACEDNPETWEPVLDHVQELASYPVFDDETLSNVEWERALDALDVNDVAAALIRAVAGDAVEVWDCDADPAEALTLAQTAGAWVENGIGGAYVVLDDLDPDGRAVASILEWVGRETRLGRLDLDGEPVQWHVDPPRASLFGGSLPATVNINGRTWCVPRVSLDMLDGLGALATAGA